MGQRRLASARPFPEAWRIDTHMHTQAHACTNTRGIISIQAGVLSGGLLLPRTPPVWREGWGGVGGCVLREGRESVVRGGGEAGVGGWGCPLMVPSEISGNHPKNHLSSLVHQREKMCEGVGRGWGEVSLPLLLVRWLFFFIIIHYHYFLAYLAESHPSRTAKLGVRVTSRCTQSHIFFKKKNNYF